MRTEMVFFDDQIIFVDSGPDIIIIDEGPAMYPITTHSEWFKVSDPNLGSTLVSFCDGRIIEVTEWKSALFNTISIPYYTLYHQSYVPDAFGFDYHWVTDTGPLTKVKVKS